jgi:hypothetical protein
MNPALLAIPLLLAQGPLCGGTFNIRPEDTPFTGCFVPSGRGDGGGAQIRMDPLAPSGYRATPVPPRELPQYIPPQPLYRP